MYISVCVFITLENQNHSTSKNNGQKALYSM